MDNLFIIRSPLQMINAYEAVKHFGLSNNKLLVIYNSGLNNTKQMKDLINILEWNEVLEIENSKSKFLKYIKVVHALKKYKYKNIFFGNFGSIQRLLLANLSYKESYLIDDGTSSIIDHKTIDNYFKESTFKLRDMRFLLLNLKIKIKQQINFFTIFDLSKLSNEIIIKHTFENTKKRYNKDIICDETIYLLGQNLTQAKVVGKNKYLFYIETILKKYKNHKIIYIPHRTEIIHEELKLLQSNFFDIRFINQPIELYFLVNNIVPKKIISFHSTALYTLRIILDKVPIEAYLINLEDIEEKKDIIKLCQNFLNETNIKKIKLDKYEI